MPRSRSACKRVAAAEPFGLVPTHDPAEPGLQRRDPGTQLVPVQRQAGLEAQGVPGAEAGREDTGGEDRVPEGGGHLDGHGALDTVLARVAGAGGGHDVALPVELDDAEAGHRGGLGGDGREQSPRLGPLHRDDGPARR